MPESRFDSEKDKREYMFEKSLEYAENRGNVIAENLKAKDAARGIDKGPDYDYYSVGYVLAVRQFEGHDFDRGKAEAIVEQNRERHLVREIKNLKEERTEQNKDSSYTKERTESLEKQ